ncbi:hypothetical protein PR003_g33741 [Phytophthora rubi]|nr:hypothetical protein PR003_g33741 [Phytophthora rubi]
MRVGCLQPAGDGGRVPALHTLGKLRLVAYRSAMDGGATEIPAFHSRDTLLQVDSDRKARGRAAETSTERSHRLEGDRARRAKKKADETSPERR